MMIFVSAEDVDDPLARALMHELAERGWSVEHSPRNPARGDDTRWQTWYATGCAEALARAVLFVGVVTSGWDGSSWMAHEADSALRAGLPVFLWNPRGTKVPVGMRPYAARPLAESARAAAAELSDHGPRLRAARIDEAPGLSELALRSKASWGYPPTLMRSFESELTLSARDLAAVWVLELAGAPVGFYSLQPLSETHVELGHLFLDPKAQGRGLGRSMITDALLRAATRGFSTMLIQGDPNAAEFYQRVGARRVGERESDSIPGRMLPLFELSIP